MSVKSKNRKNRRLEPKVREFYEKYNKWLNREPPTHRIVEHHRWEKEEPVKPKWLKDFEAELDEGVIFEAEEDFVETIRA